MWELMALYGAVVAWGSIRLSRRRLRRWREAATASGLTVEEISNDWSWALRIKAREGPLEVRIEQPSRARDHDCSIAVLVPGPPGFSGIRIRPEAKRFGAHEVEIGDEPFDKAFYIVGPMRLLFALLDAETRHLLLSVNAGGQMLEIVGGELRVKAHDSQIDLLLRLLLDIGRRFAQPLDAAQRLAENARRDPDAEVRLRNLLLLTREFPAEPATREALRTACADKSPRIRLRAAKELGTEGREVLLEVAEATTDDLLSAEAVSLLGQDLPVERTRAILLQSLRKRLHRTARACIEALGRSTAAVVPTRASAFAAAAWRSACSAWSA